MAEIIEIDGIEESDPVVIPVDDNDGGTVDIEVDEGVIPAVTLSASPGEIPEAEYSTEHDEQGITQTILTAESAAQQAQAARDEANNILTEIETKRQTALNNINNAQNNAISTINTAARELSRNASRLGEMNTQIERNKNAIRLLQNEALAHVDGGYVENGVAYFTNNGEVLFEITGIGGGGGSGGGSSGNTAVLTVTNTTGWAAASFAKDADVIVTLNWSSIDQEQPTGDGTLSVIVGGVTKAAINEHQGNISVNLKNYLGNGANTVKLLITDSYGNSRQKNFTITIVDMYITSTFDPSIIQTGDIAFPYIPFGDVDKLVHFVLDGVAFDEVETGVSGRQVTYNIPTRTHGAHSLLVYFTADLNGTEFRSNELYYEFISIEEGVSTPIIASSYNPGTVAQFATISIPFTVYDPTSMLTDVTVQINGTTAVILTDLDRSTHAYSCRMDTTGQKSVALVCGSTRKTIVFTVTESEIDVEAETDNLALYLSSTGRSNAEEHPDTWTFGSGANAIAAVFSGFNWVSNGWIQDGDNVPALRLSGTARVTIPYQIFGADFRTSGKTIEIEFSTQDVRDYSSPMISCVSGGRGLTITPQLATLQSESSHISMQFREDDHIRLSFVIEKRNEDRLVIVFVNGIPSGVVQYPYNDDFTQASPVGISIGSSGCTTNVYCIRVYDNDLNRTQILDNWIADTQDGEQMLARYSRNNVYDRYGKIVISQLPGDLPYMIIEAEELPQYKGDKKIVSGSYTDPLNPAKSFTFTGCQINVQGTSSAPYVRKNYDMQFKNGFETVAGHADNYALRDTVVPFNRFVMKADVASSEGANNVELVRLFNDACPFTTREMEEDSRIRHGIDGFPIVIFWYNTGTRETSFLGKYNFNLPKRAPAPYGYSGNMESWEFQNNTSYLMRFLTDYFDMTPYTDPDTGDTKALWRYDYEARMPSDEWTDIDKLQELQSFVYSCYRAEATGDTLANPVTYEGVEYTADTSAYRLAKFRNEFGNYAEVSSFLFYYIFTELFLMVDSRAKNLFIGFKGSNADLHICESIDRKAVAEPYDMDTAIGTNNEGALVFGYSLEDTDHLTGGDDVFNGQDSVLWCNIRDAFPQEIRQMYQTLRSNGVLSYANVERRYEEHQSKWPEAVWIEDSWFKYIDPLVNPDPGKDPTALYLPMMQGSKEEQRKWWLYNRFQYMDSKWNAGDALSNVIQLRGYSKANITVTPYADIYPTIKYASYVVQARGTAGTPTTLVCPVDDLNDTEIYIYSAPQIADIGDLSGLTVGLVDVSKATKLQQLIVGSTAQGYDNARMYALTLGTNRLLTKVDCRNCSGLGLSDQKAVDLSGCSAIEEVYFDGTNITSVSLPNGGVLKKLHLPGTITALTVRNQSELTEFVCPDYSHITTLWLENPSSAIDTAAIVEAMPDGGRIRLFGFAWEVESLEDVDALFDKLDNMRGLDQAGNNTQIPQLFGSINVTGTVALHDVEAIQARYPDVTITYAHYTTVLTLYNFEGDTVLGMQIITDGGSGTSVTPPAHANTDAYTFGEAKGWALAPYSNTASASAFQNVTRDRNIYAAYEYSVVTYQVIFKLANADGGTTLATLPNVLAGTTPEYRGQTPTSSREGYAFDHWDPAPGPVYANTTYTAVFVDTRSVLVQFLEGTLTRYESDTVPQIADYAFNQLLSLTSVRCSAANIGLYAFQNCTNLESVDLTGNVSSISNYAFDSTNKLKTFFLRGNTVPTLATRFVFRNVNMYLIDACFYVPGEMLASYQANSAWSRLRVGLHPISDYPYDGSETISDSWATIIANAENGNTSYPLMASKDIVLDTVGTVRAYIIGKDLDLLADDTGTAGLTFLVARDFTLRHRFNPALDGMTEGTGNIGGWKESEIRSWLETDVLPLFPAELRSAIKTVKKYTNSRNTSGELVRDELTEDKLFMISTRESRTNHYSVESLGVQYPDIFERYMPIRRDGNMTGEGRTRTVTYSGDTTVCDIGPGGNSTGVTYESDVLFAFCL